MINSIYFAFRQMLMYAVILPSCLKRIPEGSDGFKNNYIYQKYIIMWWIYALLSAFFASLTAIFAKVGITNVNSDLATAIRTVIILVVAWVIVFARNEQKGLSILSGYNLLFLIISGLATGLSWIFYFKALQVGKVAQVAPVDKLSVSS